MSSIASLKVGETAQIWEKAKSKVAKAVSLHDAMQAIVGVFWDEFADSLALARAFITIPFSNLPERNQSFVSEILRKQSVEEALSADTPVLSLIATRGRQPDWNAIEESRGHVGIPLVSDKFIAEIPMVSRLLTDLGLDVDLGVDPGGTYRDDPRSHIRTFYVEDALSSVDSRGRKIIVNQEFSERYGIKTVFGGGGPYPESPQHVLAMIFFATESVNMDIARAFEPFIANVQASTARFLESERIF